MNNINEAPQWLQDALKQQSEAILALADHVKSLQSGKPDGKDQKPGTDPLKEKEIQNWAKTREEEQKAWKKQQQ